MRLKEYFTGQRFQLYSTLPAASVAKRINEAAGSMFWPFSMGVVGGVWLGHIRLQYQGLPFDYNAKPVLSGKLKDSPSGSSLELCYRAPLWVHAFYLLWYLGLTLITAALIGIGWALETTFPQKVMVISIIGILSVFPIGLHIFGTRRSDEELSDLISFLSQHIEAVA